MGRLFCAHNNNEQCLIYRKYKELTEDNNLFVINHEGGGCSYYCIAFHKLFRDKRIELKEKAGDLQERVGEIGQIDSCSHIEMLNLHIPSMEIPEHLLSSF